jgi:predicted lipoprotein with Yx(FWY)xxD motif
MTRPTIAIVVACSILAAACGGAGSAGSGTSAATRQPAAAASTASAPYAPAAPAASQDTSNGYSDYYGYGTPAPKAASPTGPLQLVTSAKLGSVLAAGNGMTLYTNKNDTPKSSACNGGCAQIWPPLLVTSGTPAAPAGLTGTLSTVTWSDGTVQVTLNGMPLYLYAGDLKSGDVTGDGVDGIWAAAKN